MLPIARAARVATVCAWAVLALVATAAWAQGPDPVDDCIDNRSSPVATGGTNGVNSVFAADLDDDGDVDVLSASANDDKIAWHENDGGQPPSFTEHVITTNADGATSVAAADLDGDGDIDVASASGNDNTVAWYENDGSDPPRFIERSITTTARNAAAVHLADVVGDARIDVIVASIGDNTIAIYENDGADPPSFTQVILTKSALGASAVYAADVDGDGDADVLSASRLDDTIAWYERTIEVDEETQEQTVVWVQHVVDSNADGAAAVFAEDLNNDGDTDVLSASSNDNKISWYENDGSDPPSFTKHVISADAQGASAVFAADLDGDGDVDVLSASRFDDKVAWYENLGGSFGNPTSNQRIITTDARGAADVLAIDLDRDGTSPPGNPDLDVLVASSVAGPIAAADKIAWHENNGQSVPSFTEREVAGGAVAPEVLLLVDVDGDLTDVDVLAVSAVDDTIVWFENDGADPPSFVESLLSLDAPGARGLFWADLDGDSDMDLVAALAGDDSIAWYENLGGGDFGDPAANRKNVAVLSADGATSVFAADLDGDLDLDVLSASADDDKIAWYENLGGGDFGDPVSNQRIISDLADGASSVFAVDLDADDDVDVLAASANDDSIRWFESDGADPPNFSSHVISDVENGARKVLAAYVDNDGKLDVIAAASIDDTIAWFEQTAVDDGEVGTVVGFSNARLISSISDFVRDVVARDVDGDGDIDVVAASSGDDSIVWHQSNLAQQLQADPPPEFPDEVVPAWSRRTLSTTAESARAVGVADLNDDGALDIVTGFFFEIAWHAGGADEICYGFDATGDDEVDGLELGLLGGAFGQICVDPGNPDEWWLGIDYNDDCLVDGDDLAILTAAGVWGTSTDPGQEERRVCAYTCP